MILGRKIKSFGAVDIGVVAPGAQGPQPTPVAPKRRSVATVELIPSRATASVEVPQAQPTESFDEERSRLWALVGLLRRANLRLTKRNLRLTKENAALRSDLTGDELTVSAILDAGALTERQSEISRSAS